MIRRRSLGVAFGAVLFLGASPALAAPLDGHATQSPTVTAADPAPTATSTIREIVVPAVDPRGDVVVSPEVAAARGARDTLVADQIAEPGQVETTIVETGAFQTLGVTWPVGTDTTTLHPQVRTRSAGAWSAWQGLETVGDDSETGSARASTAARGGTDSLWVGASDAVQLSFAATTQAGPVGLELVLVDAGTMAAPATVATAGTLATAGGSAQLDATAGGVTNVAAPVVITRDEWGAQAQACAPDVAAGLVAAVVHHTAGSNDYTTVAEAMQQIRGDQQYHIQDQGWCDIGYNFLVDKWGNIYEGRANSFTQPIIGVHAAGFNTGTLGVAMLGTFTDGAPPTAMQDAVGQIIGWRLGSYGLDPQGSVSYVVGANSKFPAGSTQTMPRIFGHRDGDATVCPGDGGYAALPYIRTVAATYAGAWQAGIIDVSMSSQFYADILWLSTQGITTGYSDRTFQPSGLVTRAATAAFLYRFATPGTATTVPSCTGTARTFNDVPDGSFCGAIEWLASSGIATGGSDGNFHPGNPVSREAMAAFLYRLTYGHGSATIPACTGTTRTFADVPATSPFCGAIEKLAADGILRGFSNGTFLPARSISREAMAAYLHRLSAL